MGKLVEALGREVEYLLDCFVMYHHLGCESYDSLRKDYREVMNDALKLHLIRRTHEDDTVTGQIKNLKALQSRIEKLEDM